MDKIEETLNKLGEVRKLAETVKNLAFEDNGKGEIDYENVNEATRQAVYELAETLGPYEHGRLIVALAASHAAKYGEDYLPEKARTWLQRHEWVRTVAIAILALIAAWGLNSCTYTSSQVAADGSTANRVFAVDAATARDWVKLYGFPEVPCVKVQNTK